MDSIFRVVIGILALIALGLAAGWISQIIRNPGIRKRFPPPGRLFDVGGRRMHILCKGETGPTVVFEAGGGGASFTFWPLQDRIAAFARVCVYDRAGYGWSDPAASGRPLEARAADLHALLHAAQIPPPYILVGHSLGGLYIRVFARDHPNEVAGMVFIDSGEEALTFGDMRRYEQTNASLHETVRVFRRLELTSRFGLLPLLNLFPAYRPPTDIPVDALAMASLPSSFRAVQDEYLAMFAVPNEMAKPGSFGGPVGAAPVIVLTANVDPNTPVDLVQKALDAHKRLAALSSNSRHIMVPGAGHFIQTDAPETVLEAVRSVHEAARTGRPLAG